MKRYNHNALLVPDTYESVQQYGLDSHRQHPGGPSSGDDGRIDFSTVWDTIKRGKWIILATCVLVTAAITIYTLTLTPVFEASSYVSVDPEPTPGVMNYGQIQGISAEIGELQYSSALAGQVAQELKATAEAMETAEYFPILRSEDGSEASISQVARRLRDRMEFAPIELRNMIQITAISEVPEEAAAIANLYAEEYQEYQRQRSRASIVAAREFLEEQVAQAREELRQMENRWAAFARSNEMATLGPSGERLAQQYTLLLDQRNALERERARLQTRRGILQNRLAEVQPTDVRSSVAQQQEMASIESQISQLTTEINALRREAEAYYINYPDLRGDEARIQEDFERLAEINRQIEGLEATQERLTDELVAVGSRQTGAPASAEGGALSFADQLRAQVAELGATITELESQIAGLNASMGGYEGRLEGIPGQTISRIQLERELNLHRQFLTTYTTELRRTEVAEQSELGYVHVVRNAGVPGVPVSPNLKQNIVLGLMLGLGLGIGLAFIKQAAVSRFRRPEDVQEQGYSLVGVIPRMDREIKAASEGKETVEVDGHNVSTRLLPLHNPWSPISENYRLVRTNLQHTSGDGVAPRVLLMTSPEPADGKTLTAVNLGISVAQSGRRTLIVDADLRRPAVHLLFDLPNRDGLAEILRGERELSGSMIETGVDNLDFLPAGKTEFPPAELLGSQEMKEALDDLRRAYDIIIVDSPPVLAVSDPVLLATHCDATLVVVSADRTDTKALEVTRQTLGAVGVPIAGIIFNRFDAYKSSGYGYGYRNDYEEYTSALAK